MSRTTLVRTMKMAGIATAGALLVGTVGSASAAPVSAPEGEGGAVRVPVSVIAEAPVSSRVTAPAARVSRAVARRTVQVAAWAAYTHFTLRSTATRDMRGVERSLYRGRYYRASVESIRRCIATRESEGHYDVVSPSGLYFGAYQVSRPLARGATWMMLREHRALMGPQQARSVLTMLRSRPMNAWPRYWQDAAFFTVWNWEHTGSGAAHWAGGRWRC